MQANLETENRASGKGPGREAIALYAGGVLILIALALLCRFFGKNFLTVTNLFNIITQASVTSIIAIGASLVILTGGIDLSPGAVVAFVGIAGGMMLKGGLPIPLFVAASLVIGAAAGALNGVLVSFGKVPAFIATLGMMQILRGAAMVLCSGIAVSGFTLTLNKIMNTKLFGVIPISVLYVFVLYAIMCFVMSCTKFGRGVYALGGNLKAARLSGISVNRGLVAVYSLAGIFSAIGGVLLLSRLCYADPNAGDGYEMDAIAAAVIGGISLTGGKGKIGNTLVGALILSMLTCGLQIMNMPTFYQSIITGVVIITAVFADKYKERKSE